MKDEFTTFDIINKLGIPRGRLREWMNEGFIVPSVQKAEGVGTKALFDRVDIVTIVIFKHLIEAHKIARSEAATIVKDWAKIVHLFKTIAEDKDLQYFLDTQPHFQVLGKGGKNHVAEIIFNDIFLKYCNDDNKKKIKKVLGEDSVAGWYETADILRDQYLDQFKPLRHKLGLHDMKYDEFYKIPYAEYDFILQINFRRIIEEAKKVWEE